MDEINLFQKLKEAFSIHGKATQEDINPEYIGALISGIRTNISPCRIQRIPRSHNISIKNNTYSFSIYDPLKLKKCCY